MDYQVAQDRIDAGLWKVDSDAGLIWNDNGRRLGHLDPHGYWRVSIAVRSGTSTVKWNFLLHRVIWGSVHGVLTDPADVLNHINGIKTDNRLSNLEIVTSGENVRLAYQAGLMAPPRRGEHASGSKLTAEDVAEIRRRCHAGENQRVVAADFGVNRGHVALIVTGRRWAHTLSVA